MEQSSSRLVSDIRQTYVDSKKRKKNYILHLFLLSLLQTPETNRLEDCLKISRFRIILTGKEPLSHQRSFIQVGGYSRDHHHLVSISMVTIQEFSPCVCGDQGGRLWVVSFSLLALSYFRVLFLLPVSVWRRHVWPWASGPPLEIRHPHFCWVVDMVMVRLRVVIVMTRLRVVMVVVRLRDRVRVRSLSGDVVDWSVVLVQ